MFNLEMTEEKQSNFDDFWSIVPRKAGSKKKAKLIWDRLTDKIKLIVIHDIQERYRNTEKLYIPHPTTYLNGQLWECEIEHNVKMPRTNDEWLAEGRRLGIEPRRGETYTNYKTRLSTAMRTN